MKPADGVIKTSPAMAPMKVESSGHLPVSKYVMEAHVMAPAEAQRFVTLSVVSASKASQEFQMIPSARSWHIVFCGP